MTAVDITESQDGGIKKTILQEGSGESPLTGDTVSVHYVGTLLDTGDGFDSSRDRGDKFEFKLGVGQVIKGWDVGVATMKRGEKADLVCTAPYAYGEAGSGAKIPPNSTLKFEVELFDFYGDDISKEKDKSMTKRIHVKGDGYATPNEGATMDVLIEAFTIPANDKIVSVADKGVVHGEESRLNLPACVETVLDNMKKGEKCEVIVQPKHAFTASHNIANAPIGVPVKFEITLNSFEKAKESWEMTLAEKIEDAQLKRTKATGYLKEGKFEVAEKIFGKVLKLLEGESAGNASISDSDDEEGGDVEKKMESEPVKKDDPESQKQVEEIGEILQACNLNLSLCYLKTDDLPKAIEHCDKVLDKSPDSEKALYRRAEALFKSHSYLEAKDAYAEVVRVAPSNASARKRQFECDQKVIEDKKAEKATYGKMFRNFST
jgi:FK506-binding protein 4/5